MAGGLHLLAPIGAAFQQLLGTKPSTSDGLFFVRQPIEVTRVELKNRTDLLNQFLNMELENGILRFPEKIKQCDDKKILDTLAELEKGKVSDEHRAYLEKKLNSSIAAAKDDVKDYLKAVENTKKNILPEQRGQLRILEKLASKDYKIDIQPYKPDKAGFIHVQSADGKFNYKLILGESQKIDGTLTRTAFFEQVGGNDAFFSKLIGNPPTKEQRYLRDVLELCFDNFNLDKPNEKKQAEFAGNYLADRIKLKERNIKGFEDGDTIDPIYTKDEFTGTLAYIQRAEKALEQLKTNQVKPSDAALLKPFLFEHLYAEHIRNLIKDNKYPEIANDKDFKHKWAKNVYVCASCQQSQRSFDLKDSFGNYYLYGARLGKALESSKSLREGAKIVESQPVYFKEKLQGEIIQSHETSIANDVPDDTWLTNTGLREKGLTAPPRKVLMLGGMPSAFAKDDNKRLSKILDEAKQNLCSAKTFGLDEKRDIVEDREPNPERLKALEAKMIALGKFAKENPEAEVMIYIVAHGAVGGYEADSLSDAEKAREGSREAIIELEGRPGELVRLTEPEFKRMINTHIAPHAKSVVVVTGAMCYSGALRR